VIGTVPMRRYGRMEVVAGAVAFLLGGDGGRGAQWRAPCSCHDEPLNLTA
jgi:hypothetical protein